eukprot:g13639.t1
MATYTSVADYASLSSEPASVLSSARGLVSRLAGLTAALLLSALTCFIVRLNTHAAATSDNGVSAFSPEGQSPLFFSAKSNPDSAGSSSFLPQDLDKVRARPHLDKVRARPGLPGAVQGVSPSWLGPSCLFVYGLPLRNHSNLTAGAKTQTGWLYGAKTYISPQVETTLAVPTGEKKDIVKGDLFCYKPAQFKQYLDIADRLQDFNAARTKHGLMRRDIVNVVQSSGKSQKAFWYHQPGAQEKVFRVHGKVIKGFNRGSRLLGTPTANLDPSTFRNVLTYALRGVYFGWAQVEGGEVYKAAITLGINPTVENVQETVEAHLLHEFAEDFYGSELKLIICGYIRTQRKYNGLDELKKAIQQDIQVASNSLDDPFTNKLRGDSFFSSLDQSGLRSEEKEEDKWEAIPRYKSKKRLISEGDADRGKVARDMLVTVHATGVVVETGRTFWSTKDAGQEPFTYLAGHGNVITGWDQGCLGMAVGEVAELLIPAEEGYGKDGFPAWGIPPMGTLKFTIEILDLQRA